MSDSIENVAVVEPKPPLIARGITRRLLDRERLQPAKPDQGFAWVIALMSFILHFVVLGTLYSFGVFLVPIRVELDISNQAASWILSTNQACMLGIGPIAGRLIEKFGFRLVLLVAGTLYCAFMLGASFSPNTGAITVLYGVLMGASGGCVFSVAVQSVVSWFFKKRGVGVGLAVSGSGIGNFAVANIAGVLIDQVGWRITLRWFALFSAIFIFLTSLFVRRRLFVPTNAAQRKANNQRALALLRKRPFIMLFCGSLIVSFGFFTPFLFIRAYALAQGVTADQATFLLSGLGIASTFGRIVFGLAADMTSPLWTIRLSFLALGVVTIALVGCTTLTTISVFVAIYGACAGAFIALVAPVCALYFPLELMPSLTGAVYFGAAIGNLFGPPISGALIDASTAEGGAKFHPAFLFAGVMMTASSLFLFLLPQPPAKPLVFDEVTREAPIVQIDKEGDLESIASFDSCESDDIEQL